MMYLESIRVVESNSLLNTKEAAQYLRVSEASIRRWSDSGLLPAQRVGRRQERRFTRGDLKRYLGQGTDQGQQAPGFPAVNVGGTSVPVRSHLSPIYSTDLGGLRLSIPFLADGLRIGQPCFLAATGDVLERYSGALEAEHGIDVAAAQSNGRLTIVGWPGATIADAIAGWERLFAKALAGGPTVLRVVGEMACERPMFASEAEMMAYEEDYELMARRFPAVTLCQYDARAFDGGIILRALKSHPDMFQHHLGGFLN
jgi:excisionase family DNA binding protein